VGNVEELLMFHPAKAVANKHGLIPSDFEGFAIANFYKDGVSLDFGFAEVPDANVDIIVSDYRAFTNNCPCGLMD
jgi:hypothetical protein